MAEKVTIGNCELWHGAQGLQRLGGFKRAWNKTAGAWRNEPAENGCEHGADAFRQFGQALDTGQYRQHATIEA